MEKIKFITSNVLVFLQNSSEFCSMVLKLEDCSFICIVSEMKKVLVCKNYPLEISFSMMEVLKSIRNENVCFWEVLNFLMVQVHDHTLSHCGLTEEFCPFHRNFWISYRSYYKCECIQCAEEIDVDAVDYPVNCLKLLNIPTNKAFNRVKWMNYLKMYENQALNIYEISGSCRTSTCKINPDYKLEILKPSSNLILSVLQSHYPNFQEVLRIFTILPQTISLPFKQNSYQISSYLLLSNSDYGCLSYNPQSLEWFLIINEKIITGDFSTLIKEILVSNLFPIHALYTKSSEAISDFRSPDFYRLYTLSEVKLQTNVTKLPFLGSRHFISYSNTFWVCSCGIISFATKCENCGLGKSMITDTSKWKCICTKVSNNFVCQCGRSPPKCGLCQKFYSWKEINCLRCEGFIINGVCEVCGFKQSKLMCEGCFKSYWKCDICWYPNRRIGNINDPYPAICVRCGNPERNLYVGAIEEPCIPPDFDDDSLFII